MPRKKRANVADADFADQNQGVEGAPEDASTGDKDLWKIARWVAEITLYNKETQDWRERSKKIIRRYKDERKGPNEDLQRRLNVLWSNTQTLMPALYARNPKPDIQRRFKDADPLGRVTSDVMERCVTYFCDTDHFRATIRQAVLDYLLPGRGTVWIRYDPTLIADDVELTDDAQEGEDVAGEKIDFEDVRTDYVHTLDFGHNICRTWEEVWCAWRIVYLTRDELKRRFGDKIGSEPPLDHSEKTINDVVLDDGVSKSTIYELWDKERKVAVWLHKDIPDALDIREDPLGLEDFYPFPKPLFANLANDSCIPTPDYVEYQDQAEELDNLTGRIAAIQKCLKVVGLYDASAPGLAQMLNDGVENTMLPVDSFAMLAEKGGIPGLMTLMPLKEIQETLTGLYANRAQVKADLYEITGIADLVRGVSDPSETATAQGIKSNFATMRIADRQADVQRFVREVIRIMVDVICGHFQLETIKQISGVRLFTQAEKQQTGMMIQQHQMMAQQAAQTKQPPSPMPPLPNGMTQDQLETMMNDPTWEEVEGLLRNQPMRSFRIDIETDSTIKADQEAEKASRTEFLKASGTFLQQAVEAGAQQPALVPLLSQMLMFGIRAFPVGKELEGSFNTALQKLEKEAANPQPKPNPEMAKIQADAQSRQAELQGSMQIEQMKEQSAERLQTVKMQADAQTEAAKAQSQEAVQQHLNILESQRRMAELAGERELEQYKAQLNMQLEQAKLEQAERIATMENQNEILKARIQQETAIEVARIGAKATSGEEEEAEAQARDNEIEGPTHEESVTAALSKIMEHISKPQPDIAGAINNLASAHKASSDSIASLHKAVSGEREIVRDPKTGKATGVRPKVSPADLAKAIN